MALHQTQKWVPEDLDDAALTGNEGGEADIERAVVVDEEFRLQDGAGPSLLPGEGEEAGPTARWEELVEVSKLLTSGGLAGAISKTATAPLARLTILYQVKGLNAATRAHAPEARGVLRALRELAAREGLRSLWRGNGVTIVHRLPYSAANFWVYEAVNEQWKRVIPARGSFAPTDVTRRFVAGGLAGLAACTLAYPLDLVRTRLAAQVGGAGAYHGIANTLQTIVRDEGPRGLYRGLGATLAQVAPSLAINYAAYETMRSAWVKAASRDQTDTQSPEPLPTVPATLACGSAAGLISSTATFPLDLVRRRLQLQGSHGSVEVYASYGAVFRSIWRQEGWRGFYAGILPEYYKVVPGVAIAFCSYELLKRSLGAQTNATQR